MSDNQPFEVSLGPDGGTKAFHGLQDAQQWLRAEQEFWNEFQRTSESTGNASACWRLYTDFFSSMRSQVDDALRQQSDLQQNKRPFDPTSCIQRLQAGFKTNYEQNGLILSVSPRALYLKRLAEAEGFGIAVFAGAYFMKSNIQYTSRPAIRGALAASYFEHGFVERIVDEKKALQDLRTTWQSTFQEFEKSLTDATLKHQQLNNEGSALLDKQQKEFTKISSAEQDEWQRLHKTYDESLALHKPVTYWAKKAATHRCLAWVFGTVAVFSGCGVFALLYELIQITVRPPEGVKDVASWHPEYWRIAVLIAAGLFGVWVVRILVRIFLSNVHLLTDARERAVMVQTYLALRRKGDLKDEDRQLVLRAIFRPAGTGLAKDDAMPLTVVESLTRLGSGRPGG